MREIARDKTTEGNERQRKTQRIETHTQRERPVSHFPSVGALPLRIQTCGKSPLWIFAFSLPQEEEMAVVDEIPSLFDLCLFVPSLSSSSLTRWPFRRMFSYILRLHTHEDVRNTYVIVYVMNVCSLS